MGRVRLTHKSQSVACARACEEFLVPCSTSRIIECFPDFHLFVWNWAMRCNLSSQKSIFRQHWEIIKIPSFTDQLLLFTPFLSIYGWKTTWIKARRSFCCFRFKEKMRTCNQPSQTNFGCLVGWSECAEEAIASRQQETERERESTN